MIEDVLQRLRGVRRNGKGWIALCPAHDDREPSLSVTETPEGKVLVTCHAGCTFSAIRDRLGLPQAAFEPPRPEPRASARIVATYDYRSEAGELLFQVVRFEPKSFRQRRPDAAGGWTWNMHGVRLVPYRLPEVIEAVRTGGLVLVCEGEKDVDALLAEADGANIAATTNPQGAGKWRPEYSEALRGAHAIVIADKDEPGRRHAAQVAASLHGKAVSVRVVELPDRDGKRVKDAADFFQAGGTLHDVLDLAAAAPEWSPPKPAPQPDAGPEELPADPVARARAGKPYPYTDLGNAFRIVARNRDGLRSVAFTGWRRWDGRRWAPDPEGRQALEAAKAALLAIVEEAGAVDVDRLPDVRVRLLDWAAKSQSRQRIEAAVSLARSDPALAGEPAEFDADPWLLNVANGTLDLRTGELRPHRREDRITKLASVVYDPTAKLDLWERFLAECTGGDEELAAFLQAAAGYSLTGDTSEEKLLFVFGPGASGKTTFLEALRGCLGEYAAVADFRSFLRTRGEGPRPDLARLAGVRFVSSVEVDSGKELAESLIKSWTGGDVVAARFLYREVFEFKPVCKLWLCANAAPHADPDDDALWRRILRVPFERVVPPERRDPKLKEALRNPAVGGPAVLSWAVQGCLRWQREGLKVPEAVLASTQAYKVECDTLAPFLTECCVFDRNTVEEARLIHQAYQRWCDQNQVPARFRVSPRTMAQRLKSRGCVSGESGHDKRAVWYGVALRQTPVP